MFFSELEKRVKEINSLLCIGLDPDLKLSLEEAEKDCLDLIQKTTGIAAAYKPNSAFFEAHGPGGFETLKKIVNFIPKEIPVVLDCKRGDIGSTAEAYSRSFEIFDREVCPTLNPYLGIDSLRPCLKKTGFVLCRTSNPGSQDFQNLILDSGKFLYEEVCFRVTQEFGQKVGLVCGATEIEALKRIRQLCADTWILAPGLGAQGGNLDDAVGVGLRKDGLGILFPISRGISRAENRAEAASRFRDQINCARNKNC